MFSLRLSQKRIWSILFCVLIFGFVLRILCGYSYLHYFDLSYYVEWSSGLQQDFFGAYTNISSLDYPPILLFPLYFIGKLMQHPDVAQSQAYTILCLKLTQIVFDMLVAILLYIVVRKKSQVAALMASVVWCLNPAAFYNCAFWGQTDSMMIFFLLLTFALLENGHFIGGSIVYAIAVLAKFQCLYFAPVYFLYVVYRVGWKKCIVPFFSCIATFFAVFFPFMLKSGWFLPFKLYLGGLDKYGYATYNACNIYGLLRLNTFADSTPYIGNFTLYNLSMLLLVLIGIGLIVVFITATNKCVWLCSFITMYSIFMFTTRMHERYQIPVLLFLLMASIKYKSHGMLNLFTLHSLMIFFNQFIVLCSYTFNWDAKWIHYYDQIFVFLSGMNLVLYVVSMYMAFRLLYAKEPTVHTATYLKPQLQL